MCPTIAVSGQNGKKPNLLGADTYPLAMGMYNLSDESFNNRPVWMKNDTNAVEYKLHYLYWDGKSWVVSNFSFSMFYILNIY